MAIIAAPAVLSLPSSLRLAPVANVQSGGRSWADGTEQSLEQPGSRLAASLSFEGMDQSEWRPLLAWLADLGGQAGRFSWNPPIPRRGTASSDGGLGPRVNGASQAGKTIITTGWANDGQVALAGDLIGWNDPTGRPQLHIVTANVASAEPARTNLQVQSKDATAAGTWTVGPNCVDLGAVADPFGTTKARRLRCGASGPGNVYFARLAGLAASPTTTYTASVYLRLNAGSIAIGDLLIIDEYSSPSGTFLARTRTGNLAAAGVSGAWQRFSATWTTRADCGAIQVYWAGGWTIGAELEFDGFQIEVGAAPSALITTTTAAASRSQSISLPIAPMIRRSPADATVLNFASPPGVWRLSQNRNPLDLVRGLLGGASLDIEEALF